MTIKCHRSQFRYYMLSAEFVFVFGSRSAALKSDFLYAKEFCIIGTVVAPKTSIDVIATTNECRFYGATGRFEDDELVEEHKKAVELFNKHNAIIEIKIDEDGSFYVKQIRKYDMQQPDKTSDNNT